MPCFRLSECVYCAVQEACTAHTTGASGKFHRNDSPSKELRCSEVRCNDVIEALSTPAPDIADSILREQLK